MIKHTEFPDKLIKSNLLFTLPQNHQGGYSNTDEGQGKNPRNDSNHILPLE